MTVKQPIGLRDWHSAINKALYPFKGRDQEADNKITRQISRFQSLDPEERNATDVEQIYQVGIHEPHHDPEIGCPRNERNFAIFPAVT